jgi:hypothetical protein
MCTIGAYIFNCNKHGNPNSFLEKKIIENAILNYKRETKHIKLIKEETSYK